MIGLRRVKRRVYVKEVADGATKQVTLEDILSNDGSFPFKDHYPCIEVAAREM